MFKPVHVQGDRFAWRHDNKKKGGEGKRTLPLRRGYIYAISLSLGRADTEVTDILND